jgi:3-hydroxy-5-methyl-1-naphthoate 3-O-methyltransferase
MPNISEEDGDPLRIVDDLWAARRAQVLQTALELGVFDVLARDQPLPADEIATAMKTSVRGTRRLLKALDAMGYVVNIDDGRRYRLAPVAETYLVRARDTYLGDLSISTRLAPSNWEQLTDSITRGAPIVQSEEPEAGAAYYAALVDSIFPMSYVPASAVADRVIGFLPEGIDRILDVGAGSAAWSLPFAQRLGQVRITALDLPEVIGRTQCNVANRGLGSRYEFITGDMRAELPKLGSFDLVLLGHILHGLGPEQAQELILDCAKVLTENGVLLVAEILHDDSAKPHLFPSLFSLNMLLHNSEGDVFDRTDYQLWLRNAGLDEIHYVPTPLPSPVILARKPRR